MNPKDDKEKEKVGVFKESGRKVHHNFHPT
jgi:hypothetical protein